MPSQSQPRGAGQAAGDGVVNFTRSAAQRIAKAVRAVEGGNRDQGGLAYDHPAAPPKVFRFATFTGAWPINTNKVVTFRNQSNTPNTVSASNILFPLPELSSNTSSPTVCAIGRDGASWYLLNVMHETHSALTQIALTQTSLRFDRRDVLTISRTATTTGISVASCNTAQASPAALSYFQ